MAVEFYRDILGLAVEQMDDAGPTPFVTFDLAGAKLAIWGGGVGATAPKGVDRNAFVPNLECEDIVATVADLESRGVPFITPLAEVAEGYRTATFVDPEGNRMQLFEWGLGD